MIGYALCATGATRGRILRRAHCHSSPSPHYSAAKATTSAHTAASRASAGPFANSDNPRAASKLWGVSMLRPASRTSLSPRVFAHDYAVSTTERKFDEALKFNDGTVITRTSQTYLGDRIFGLSECERAAVRRRQLLDETGVRETYAYAK